MVVVEVESIKDCDCFKSYRVKSGTRYKKLLLLSGGL